MKLLIEKDRSDFENIRKKSIKRNIDPNITESIWKTKIREFIKYEFKILKLNYLL